MASTSSIFTRTTLNHGDHRVRHQVNGLATKNSISCKASVRSSRMAMNLINATFLITESRSLVLRTLPAGDDTPPSNAIENQRIPVGHTH